MELVDEQDHAPFGGIDLLQHGLEPVLELPAVLRPGDQRAHVQRQHPLVLQPFRDVAGDDALGQPLRDRCLADARVADQDRVVFRPTRENLDHPPDHIVPADHRVELLPPGHLGQIPAVFLERLVFVFRILVRDPLAPPDRREGGKERLAGDPVLPEQVGCLASGFRCERQEKVFGGQVLVLEGVRLGEGAAEERLHAGGEPTGHDSRDLRKCGQKRIRGGEKTRERDAGPGEEVVRDSALLPQEGGKEVLRLHLRVPALGSHADRVLKRLLGLDCELVQGNHRVPVKRPGPRKRPGGP